MSVEDPETTATKTRILTHVNADHSKSLALFLRHYCRVPSSHAKTAKMEDITLDHTIISSSFGRNLIPLDPPMKSYSEARERLVEMHKASLEGLGLSDTRVDNWRAPRGFHLILFITCSIIFISFSSRANFDPATSGFWYGFWSAQGAIPALARFNYLIQPYLITFMVVLHGTEAIWLGWSRLRKHQVNFLSRVWLAWMLDCFIEGFGCFERFDEIVREKEEAKKNRKH